ncbi:hypothetical protein [Vitiosangium sp. GDMCC 1.1324]|uniref:hypothetical protein n=1 Tax=Vitiosangium sp. (strain GDMCC 1.1324) TaxID=2138576 RepID=UPI000D3CD63F|nr:hypothetical protein [Vitiosangium sp. GDMCC 1.1324]PTL79086.1 hypothetical protein DAT35_36365 [Vitiosangium sp. GDMCC 1.1324]
MALLTINGVEVRCTASSWEPVRMGEVTRALNGRARNTSTVRKANYMFTTSAVLPLDYATALRGLIEGEGHVLSFEDTTSATSWLYTSRGAAPDVISGHSRVSGRHGSYALRLSDSAPTDTFWPLSFPASWTVLAWIRNPDIGTWVHRIGRSDGTEWENGNLGAPGESVFESCRVDVGRLGLTAHVLGTRDFDEVVALPFAIPDEWAPALYAFHSTRAFPSLPEVLTGGTRMPTGGLICIGLCGAGRTGPRLFSVVEQFDFTLYGV